jgi:histidine triad (HIT) family protein
MTDCLFCKIARGEIPSQKVYEDDTVFAFLDINPVSPGHTLVIPKEHAQMLLDASDESLERVIKAAKYIAAGILQATGATGFNLVANNHPSAGQLIEHLHFHIIPRTKDDGIELIHGKSAQKEELEKVAQKIKDAI